ncbi:peptidylprolyl isomerase [Methanosphaera sp. BMS]|uniref:peptidylprolyl isomerase n=1 Tax=Methanosphaera sp. BMS TaxID=1789762 RepID=UPI000DD358E5|nr:peptidylprolyl isomerase [Methanosphaera sp. BMS]
MPIEENDFIRLNYTGKVQQNGEVFDTTYEEVAEEAGIKVEGKDYHPIVLSVGADQVLSALQDQLIGLEVGEEKTIEIPCEDAFGKKDPSLIQLIPMKEFKQQNIRPFPGMPISLDGQQGIVRTVDGGRVRVDFNHRLAGKDIVYDVVIEEKIEDDVEKIKGLIDVYYGNPNINLEKTEVEIEDGTAKIILDKLAGFEQRTVQEVTLAKFQVARVAYENIDSVEKVQFIDEYQEVVPQENEEVSDVEDVFGTEEANDAEVEEEVPEVLNEDEQ